ncbi:MAG: neutral/alkaline non-lysosomal ceramidase N-terminal domain-containing protein [Nitrososphaerales archaeon]
MRQLKVGIGASVITPPVGKSIPLWRYRRGKAVGIHDHLLAKTIFLSDGSEEIALLTIDIVMISPNTMEKIRRKVNKLTGIPSKNVMFNCSHNHTTPTPPMEKAKEKITKGPWPFLNYDEYMAFDDYVAGTVFQAYKNMEKAEIGIGKGRVDGVTINRRHPEQPIDTQLNVIKVCKPNDTLLASLVNFQCHALAVGGQYLLWTADFPGFMREFVEKVYPNSSCFFLQGAAGDIHPWDWWLGNLNPKHQATYEEAEKLGRIIGSEACRVLEAINNTTSNVEIKAASKKIILKGRKFPWSQNEVEEVINEVLKRDKPWKKAVWPKGVTVSDIYNRYPEGYRYGLIPFMKYIAELARKGEAMPDLEAEIQVFKINDIVLVFTPGELFDKLSRKIKEESPYRNTIVLSETTTHGYIPPREAYEEVSNMSLREFIDPKAWWAYGATYTCYVAPGTGEKVVDEALKLIKEL